MLDFVHLMGRHHDGAVAIIIVVQQGIVELLAKQDVQTKRRLVEHQQSRVYSHDQRQVQLRHHALRQFPDFAFPADRGFPEKSFCFRAIESRMHAADIIERLRNPDPAWEHRHISDERNVAHEPVALVPGVASQHSQFSLIRSEAEDRVERGSLAGSVRTDKPEDAALFDPQIDAVERHGCAIGLAESACFDACHDFSAPRLADSAWEDWIQWSSTPTCPRTTVCSLR